MTSPASHDVTSESRPTGRLLRPLLEWQQSDTSLAMDAARHIVVPNGVPAVDKTGLVATIDEIPTAAPQIPEWILPAWVDIPNWLPRLESTVYYGLSCGKRLLDHTKALRASTLHAGIQHVPNAAQTFLRIRPWRPHRSLFVLLQYQPHGGLTAFACVLQRTNAKYRTARNNASACAV